MNDVNLSQKNEADCVVPVTPNDVGENVDFDFQPPLTITMVTKQMNQVSIDSESSPKTPKDDVFNPFAPGPDENMPRGVVPHSNKYTNELRNTVARQLNFHHPPPHPQEQLIVSDPKAEEAELSDDKDDCRTPPSPLMQFSAADDTCPGAPLNLKPPAEARIIQLDLCKKLDF